ncbi:hypothetical protein [Mycolicibacterium celeriflavum]|uniref:Uncharacterized protein n=1 Tax=Mycolicibacterium celeriflavum TaxID=1249101 RepID=A0A7I7RIQ5_MYCCF|nr:hypothetical protein [Mycolicibacterium celeriflavum]BBY43779.1 hypothetical protein MCEL_20740 [Mycolicibacterium celeriflavum]
MTTAPPAEVSGAMADYQRRNRYRTSLVLVVLFVALGFLLTRCPANRDGMPGQLATAMEETTSAARSGAAALDMWSQRRSTAELAAVQLSDARDQIVEAYQGIAELRAEDSADIARQRFLTDAMTDLIGTLNAASATIRQVSIEPTPEKVRAELLAAADTLESRYR